MARKHTHKCKPETPPWDFNPEEISAAGFYDGREPELIPCPRHDSEHDCKVRGRCECGVPLLSCADWDTRGWKIWWDYYAALRYLGNLGWDEDDEDLWWEPHYEYHYRAAQDADERYLYELEGGPKKPHALIAKLQSILAKLRALAERPGTSGEREAALEGIKRVERRLAAL